MKSKKYKIIEKLMKVSDEDTLYRIEEILESEASNDNFVLSQNEKDILDKRMDSHKSAPKSGKSWEDIKIGLSDKYAS
ncbi:addiction module protein [Hyunsoonleella rubra]|uniref:Addiction module protein n=1 Tax=Hyunsoonleella rubra TaxID=1737062 RepID=A0ABW5TAL1_9FLAO